MYSGSLNIFIFSSKNDKIFLNYLTEIKTQGSKVLHNYCNEDTNTDILLKSV
jgi:hypothetical protein